MITLTAWRSINGVFFRLRGRDRLQLLLPGGPRSSRIRQIHVKGIAAVLLTLSDGDRRAADQHKQRDQQESQPRRVSCQLFFPFHTQFPKIRRYCIFLEIIVPFHAFSVKQGEFPLPQQVHEPEQERETAHPS